MALWTTYLSFITRHRNEILVFLHERSGDPATAVRELYVMRNRGNNAVAPSKELLEWFLRKKKLWGDEWETRGKIMNWPQYKKQYLKLLESEQAKAWMKKVAAESQTGDVVLVCYCGPRSGKHCHRFLLAKRMQEHYGVEYKGELSDVKT